MTPKRADEHYAEMLKVLSIHNDKQDKIIEQNETIVELLNTLIKALMGAMRGRRK